MFYNYGYIFYLPINIFFILLILIYGIKKKSTYPYYGFAVIMAIYMNVAINLVYFPILTITVEEGWKLQNQIDLSLNFAEMGGLYQILGNILLTVPIGILLPLIFKLKKWKRRILTVGISFAVEIIQFFIIYCAHAITLFFDVKDILLNVCGGIIGCVLFELLSRIIVRVVQPEKGKIFRNYIYDRCYF